MGYSGFDQNCSTPVGCSIGVVGVADIIAGDGEVGLRGEVRLAY